MALPPHVPGADGAVPLSGDAQRIARLAGGALAVLGSGSLVGVSFSLWLVNHAPLALVLLSPIGRHLVLAAPLLDPVVFVVAVTARRMLFYLASFYLGQALGPPGVLWIEARAHRFGRFVRWLERIFARWGRAVILLAVGPTTSALAGISGMSVRTFTLLAVPSLVARLTAIVLVADWLEAPIRALLEWIEDHWVEGTAVMIALVGGWQLYTWRRAPRPA
jgi:membrane protein DedA with SNARE-associated domain